MRAASRILLRASRGYALDTRYATVDCGRLGRLLTRGDQPLGYHVDTEAAHMAARVDHAHRAGVTVDLVTLELGA